LKSAAGTGRKKYGNVFFYIVSLEYVKIHSICYVWYRHFKFYQHSIWILQLVAGQYASQWLERIAHSQNHVTKGSTILTGVCFFSGKLAAGGESGKVVAAAVPDAPPKMSLGAAGLERGRKGSFGRGMG
jgi:hypothetical protein